MPTDKTVLLPCPFCGSSAMYPGNPMDNGLFAVLCTKCGGEADGDTAASAIANWNRRPSEPQGHPLTPLPTKLAEKVLRASASINVMGTLVFDYPQAAQIIEDYVLSRLADELSMRDLMASGGLPEAQPPEPSKSDERFIIKCRDSSGEFYLIGFQPQFSERVNHAAWWTREEAEVHIKNTGYKDSVIILAALPERKGE